MVRCCILHLAEAFTPTKITTKVLQSELTLDDFYGEWLTCKFKTKKIGSAFASALFDSMVERNKKLLTGDIFLSAILLDPR